MALNYDYNYTVYAYDHMDAGCTCSFVHLYIYYIDNKPSAETGSLSLIDTTTLNGLSDATRDMTVNSMAPSDSTALLVPSRNLITLKSTPS